MGSDTREERKDSRGHYHPYSRNRSPPKQDRDRDRNRDRDSRDSSWRDNRNRNERKYERRDIDRKRDDSERRGGDSRRFSENRREQRDDKRPWKNRGRGMRERDQNSPLFVPRGSSYFQHDDRSDHSRGRFDSDKKSDSQDFWRHDKFEETHPDAAQNTGVEEESVGNSRFDRKRNTEDANEYDPEYPHSPSHISTDLPIPEADQE